MSKHKTIPKKIRLELHNRYNQKCAYCGCELAYKDMQIDHINSVYVNNDLHNNMTEEEMYSVSNLMPSCRQCNFYKSTMSIDDFRTRLTTTLMDNLKKNFNYKMALKYGMVTEDIQPIRFYFEVLKSTLN